MAARVGSKSLHIGPRGPGAGVRSLVRQRLPDTVGDRAWGILMLVLACYQVALTPSHPEQDLAKSSGCGIVIFLGPCYSLAGEAGPEGRAGSLEGRARAQGIGSDACLLVDGAGSQDLWSAGLCRAAAVDSGVLKQPVCC